MSSSLALHSAVCAALSTLLAACANFAPHPPPALAALTPDALATEASLAPHASAAAIWPSEDWWRALDDDRLDALIDEALADSPGLAIADARLRAAQAQTQAADAPRKPALGVAAGVAGSRLPPMLPPLADGHFGVVRDLYLSGSWQLDLWGGQRAAWQAALGRSRAAEVDARAARIELSAAVVEDWFRLAAADAQRKLAEAELARAGELRELTRRRVESGLDGKLALLQIEGAVAADRAALEAARQRHRAAGLALASLLGAGPDRAASIAPAALGALPDLTLPAELPAELLGRRPDLVAARWRVEAAGAEIQAVRARFLPNLGIRLLAGLIAPSQLDLFSLGNRFYSVAPALSLPLFDGGARRAELDAKAAARDLAIADYNQILVHAINEIAELADRCDSLARQLDAERAARANAAAAFGLAEARYRAGVGSLLESLEVRRELIASEQQLALAEASRAVAWARLNAALGGGFRAADRAPPAPEAALSLAAGSGPRS